MDFRVLGPLEIVARGGPVPTGSHKQRTVLAMLLMNSGRLVGLDELIDELWETDPPASAVANVRTYAANLRRLLAANDGGRTRIGRRGSGYVLTVERGELDLSRYEELLSAARAARMAADPGRVAQLLGQAEALWRGTVLEDVRLGGALTAHRTALTETRHAAVDECAAALLEAGDAAAAVALLREQVRRQPLREPSVALLMRALHRLGDVPGATAAFNRLRADLVSDLGVEPGAELQAMHRAVLRRAGAPASAPVTAGPDRIPPRQLPPAPVTFVGRVGERATLRAVFTTQPPLTGRCVVAAVHGRGGVGKSALAVCVGHDVAEQYPDGQIYVDLQGSTPGLRPRTVREALDHCLRAVGVPMHELPSDDGDAAALLRSVLADRRLLLLLDNATDEAQVGPLLPAAPGCAVIVTSRRMLASLDAEVYLPLDGLSPDESVALIGRGEAVGDAHLGTIAGFCEHLPLALRIVGARLASRADLTPAELDRRLADQGRRLDELGYGGMAVRTCIRVSYDGLVRSDDPVDQAAAAAFRALGLIRIPRPDAGVVAALVDRTDLAGVGLALDRLVECRLAEPAGSGYQMHDLVRLVAMECAEEEIAPQRRAELVHCALTHLIAAARRADDLIRPGRRRTDRDFAVTGELAQVAMQTTADAVRWLEAARPNLLAAAEQSAGAIGEDRRFAVRLAEVIRSHLDKSAAWAELTRLAALALEVAEADSDASSAAQAWNTLAMVDLQQGRYASAEERLARAVVIYSALPEPDWLANTYNTLALVAKANGDLQLALNRLRRCAELTREHGLPVLEQVVAHNTGEVHLLLREWSQARQHLRDSLAGKRRGGDRGGLPLTLCALGVACCQLGEFHQAMTWLNEAVQITSELSQRSHLFLALVVRSETNLRAGRPEAALADARAALPVVQETGHRYTQAVVLRQLAACTAACGEQAEADLLAEEARAAFAALREPHNPILEMLVGQRYDLSTAVSAAR